MAVFSMESLNTLRISEIHHIEWAKKIYGEIKQQNGRPRLYA